MSALALEALPILEQAKNHAGLVRVWNALSEGREHTRTHGGVAQATEQTLRHARLAGQPQAYMFGLDNALALGPRPADEALRTLDAAFPESVDPRLLILAPPASDARAFPGCMGRRAGGKRALARAHGEYRRDGDVGGIAVLEGDHAAAVRFLRRQCKLFEERGPPLLSTYAPLLGRSLCALGRHDEAEPLAELGRELGDEQDVMTQMVWRQVQALVYSSRGQHSEAEPLAREAVDIAQRTDGLNYQGDTYCDLAEVLVAAGRSDEAADALEQALERYERKRNLAQAAHVRERLNQLAKALPECPSSR